MLPASEDAASENGGAAGGITDAVIAAAVAEARKLEEIYAYAEEPEKAEALQLATTARLRVNMLRAERTVLEQMAREEQEAQEEQEQGGAQEEAQAAGAMEEERARLKAGPQTTEPRNQSPSPPAFVSRCRLNLSG